MSTAMVETLSEPSEAMDCPIPATTDEQEKKASSDEPIGAQIELPPAIDPIVDEGENETFPGHLQGWRLHLLTAGLCLSLFLSSLDITIVSTSLATIANDLDAFDQSGWIVSGYLITYFSFMIIWAKLSDIFGRKMFLATALVLFLVFSGACGGAQTIVQLIVFRAFQGVGGAGLYSMTPAIVTDMVPVKKFASYIALTSSTIGISFLLGPIIGGAINNNATWRWIFFINLPVGTLALVFALVAMPNGFPNHGRALQGLPKLSSAIHRIDFPGFAIFLAACLMLVCALQEAGTQYSWSSAFIIISLAAAAVLYIIFFVWERIIEHRDTLREAVLPWHFLTNRVLMGVFLTALFAGVPLTTIIIELPQKFQAVNQASPLSAGVRLLPFSLSCALSSALSGAFTSYLQIPPIFVILAGALLQIIGFALSYALPISLHVSTSQYGYQVLAGFGVGLTLTTILTVAPFLVKHSDRAVALGAVTQLRVLGGAIGVSIAANLLNSHIRRGLSFVVPPSDIESILKSTQMIATLDPAVQERVRVVFAEGYNMGNAAILGFTVAQFLSIALMWERSIRRLP